MSDVLERDRRGMLRTAWLLRERTRARLVGARCDRCVFWSTVSRL